MALQSSVQMDASACQENPEAIRDPRIQQDRHAPNCRHCYCRSAICDAYDPRTWCGACPSPIADLRTGVFVCGDNAACEHKPGAIPAWGVETGSKKEPRLHQAKRATGVPAKAARL